MSARETVWKETGPGKAGLPAPVAVLSPGVVYSADNGRLICLKCAGMSAKYTGRDISGQKVTAMNVEDAIEWVAAVGRPMACERGCTSYAGLSPAHLLAVVNGLAVAGLVQ